MVPRAKFACFLVGAFITVSSLTPSRLSGDRFSYLDESDPFYVHRDFPKLTTPQWIGDKETEAVVVLAIDDMSSHGKYEAYLRPIIDRLKQIDGKAHLSIMCNALNPSERHLQTWLKEGVSLEVHTLSHPCPLLAKGDFEAAENTYFGGIDLLNQIPGNRPVAYRMPCCDSINSPSPRFYYEIFNRTNEAGQFLSIDSSVMCILTPQDESLPRDLVVDTDGREKFRKYLPFPSFVTTIEDYPYPYVIGKSCWEFPCMVASDWEAQNLHGVNNPTTVADWKAALDAVVLKQGVFNLVFHPHGWITNEQVIEFINYSVETYGDKVKFLNFQEAQARLDENLLAGQPLRAANGQDNGVRLLDVNGDGYLDVVIGNENLQQTRIWRRHNRIWWEMDFPLEIVAVDEAGERKDRGVRFGMVGEEPRVTALSSHEEGAEVWQFDVTKWVSNRAMAVELLVDGQRILTQRDGKDRGVRFRDIDNQGDSELLVSNPDRNLILTWSDRAQQWTRLPFALPAGTSLVDKEGEDGGLRFVDVNEDGFDDILFSNADRFSFHLYIPRPYLGFARGWSREVIDGRRGDPLEIPPIVRGGPHSNNGAWVRKQHLWFQNEDTAQLPDLVDRRSFQSLLAGLQPPAKTPEESLQCFKLREGFTIELVAQEPLIQDPVAFEWGADGSLWVAEMGDYPLGIDGNGEPGGRIRRLEDLDGDGLFDEATVFMDGVNFPTGVMPWRDGVLVSAAPEIFFARDTDGDGRADEKNVLLTGFHEGNQQHRVNGFEYGLDGWIYVANGDSGGEVRVVGKLMGPLDGGEGQNGSPVNIRGRDLRFKPDEGLFEPIAGQTQFGRRRDDWGHWFGNNNPNWLWHFHMPEHYFDGNPFLAIRSNKRTLANQPDGTRVFDISRGVQRYNDVGRRNHVTSGCSPAPYRDDLFGAAYATSVFISEPAHNVVHREVLEPDGVSFVSHRAAGEETREFIASTDHWFRPTMLKTGPDGALYVADIYRRILEHPEWIPDDVMNAVDVRAGHDLGRLYRIYPEGATLRKVPRLNQLKPIELSAAMESANGWQRDTVQRLLVCGKSEEAQSSLIELVTTSPRPKVRLQALSTLENLGELAPEILIEALEDKHPRVRELAVRLSEQHLNKVKTAGNPSPELIAQIPHLRLVEDVLKMADDPDTKVRFQVAFTLGKLNDPRVGGRLMNLAMADGDSEAFQAAVLSSLSGERFARIIEAAFLDSPPEESRLKFLEVLVRQAVIQRNQDGLDQAFFGLMKSFEFEKNKAQANPLPEPAELPPPDPNRPQVRRPELRLERIPDVAVDQIPNQVDLQNAGPAGVTVRVDRSKFPGWQLRLIGAYYEELWKRYLRLDPERRARTGIPAHFGNHHPKAIMSKDADEIELVDLSTRPGRLAPKVFYSGVNSMISQLNELARDAAADGAMLDSDRVLALDYLTKTRHGLSPNAIGALLAPGNTLTVQEAVVRSIGALPDGWAMIGVLENWQRFSPQLRIEAGTVILQREAWALDFLGDVRSGRIPTAQVPPLLRNNLLNHRVARVSRRARTVFRRLDDDRPPPSQHVARVMELEGDSDGGQELFAQHCAVCHRFAEVGNPVGPDLQALANKSVGALVVAIVSPNQAVEDKFTAYTVATKDGREYSGLIADETSSAIVLRTGTGAEEIILRSDIEQLSGSRLSFMPEGFGESLSASQLADLVAYLRSR